MLANPGLFKRSRLQWLLNTATLKLPLTNSDTLDSRITATRASTKTYFDSTGTMRTAAINEFPREYDPSTLVCLGRSFWEARTNLLTYSEQFDNAAWTKFGTSSVSANSTVSPDGATTGDTVSQTAVSGAIYADSTVAGTSTLTASIYVRTSSTSTSASIYCYWLTGGVIQYVALTFNPSTGAYISNVNSGATSIGYAITSVGGAWFRVSVSGTGTDAANTKARFQVFNNTSGSSAIVLWGAQLELGATLTPYIPTTSASVTRSADVASMTGTNFSSWYNQTEGTFLATAMVPYVIASGENRRIIDAGDGSSNNIISLINTLASSVNRVYSTVRVGGATQADLNTTSSNGNTVAGTSFSSAFAYKANDFAASHLGTSVLTDTSGTLPTVDRFSIGLRNDLVNTTQMNGWISRIAYWPVRLPASDLPILSRSI